MDDELNLYKLLIEYIGSPVKFSELNTLLRTTYAKKDYTKFARLVKPYQELAEFNRSLGFNVHTTVYRGIQFRSKKYEKWWYDYKELEQPRKEFPYLKDIEKIKKNFTTVGSTIPINQLLSTTNTINVALYMAGAQYFKFNQNPIIAKNMYRFIFKIPLLKSNAQINAMKLYTYFKKKYDLKKLGLEKEIIDSFLLQINSLNIDEIIIVPDVNSDCVIKDVETIETGFLSTHTKFTDIQSEIIKEYYKLYNIPEDIRLFNIDNKDNIITKNTYFIKMSIG